MDSANSDALKRTVREVRRRYRLRVALRGAAICLGAALVTFAISAFGLDQFRYSPWAVAAFRVFAYTAVLGLLVRFLALPLLTRVSDEQVALYVEEHEPSLDAALVSAVESEPRAAAGRAGLSPELVRRLVETAVERVERIEYGRLVERPRLNRFAALLAGAAGLGMLGALLSPAFIRQAAPYLLAPWSVRAASPYAIDVDPGHAAIARGSDQLVSAKLHGFDSDRVELASKEPDGEWKRQQMLVEPGAGDYRLMLLAVDRPTEYFVESSGVRSAVFRIDVVDRPYVKRIDLEYVFPAYTGLKPQKVEDGGDVAALLGSEVRLSITPTIRVGGGRLLVEGAPPQELTLDADGRLAARLAVVKDGFYKIELPGSDGVPRPASPDYAITVLKDQPPAVSFVKPGRDSKVSPIEEVFAEIKAEDDFGVARLELVYSVNGAAEQTLALHKGAARKFVSAGHTFFLEEMGLQTGDFVSYYARARDAGQPGQTATTDIYFLEARPFRRDYRQAEQGGMPGGGGGQRDGALSQQQRQIIAATFKLVRDRARLGDKEAGEDLATIALVQGRLREQAETLLSRMSTRGILEPGSDFQATASELRLAVAEMKNAESILGDKRPKEALPPEQRALAHLQRAEGAFRDVQVAFGQQGGGGGGSGAQAEDLADLFELELDKLQNQYETVQRGAQEKADEQVDEALQRLQELARRQEAENERLRQRGARAPNQGGGGGSQRELADEAEELGRRLERLARERAAPSLEETARRLREAADAMRRSAASGRGGQAADGQAALDRLKDARRLLQNQREARLDRDLKEARQKAEELGRAQERIASEVKESAGAGGAGGERGERLMQRKDALASQVAELEQQLDRMARDSRREQKEASRKLQETANAIRDQKLKEKIRYSKGLLRGRPEQASQFEDDIGRQIGELGRRLSDAESSIGESDDQKRSAALDKARGLVRNMESLEERLRAAQGAVGRQADQGEPAGQLGERGQREGQGGQAGERPGEEGGPGQQGEGSGSQRGQDGRPGQGQAEGGGQGEGQNADGRAPGGRSLRGPGMLNPGGGPGFMGGEDPRQLRRELRERVGEAQELQRELRRGGLAGDDAESILRRMRALERSVGDPRGLAELAAQVVEDLKMLEYALRRQAEGEKPKLYLSGSEELPPGYKALVEEYYRALARKQK